MISTNKEIEQNILVWYNCYRSTTIKNGTKLKKIKKEKKI